MSLQELQKEIEQQKQQQLSVDTQTEATESRRKSVHDHHPSIALLEKNENHLERRKEALMKHTGYQVDPAWWDSKLRMIKKAQAAHHKVVNSISMDHPNIEIGMLSTGLAGLRYDSDGSDEEPQPSLASHQYNVSGTEIIHGDVDPVTPRFGRDDSKTNADSEFFGLKMQETIDPLKLTDDQKEQFEAQKKQLEKVLKNFDKLLANYEHATANLEILSKIAFDKEDKKNEIKELDDKFTKEINAQNEKINRINNNVISIEESLKQMNTSQNEALTSLQSSIANIGQSIEETKKVQSTLITERNEINTTNVNASDESNKEIESKLDQLINSMNNSFTSVSNQMNNMSQNIDKNMTSLSKQVENVSNLQQQLQEEQEQQRQALQQQQQTLAANESSSYKAVSEKEDVPLLNSKQELEPKDYFLKRSWCCGLVCLTYACGCGNNCC